MLRPSRATVLALCIALAPPVRAQQPVSAITVQTFTLRHLRPGEAAKLVAPYVMSPMGGVFEAGGSLRAITVRETPQTLARIDSVLRAHDRIRQVIRFRFQLLSADDTPTRDPAVAAVDSALRRLFRFAGYRLLAEGATAASDHEAFSLTLAGDPERFVLGGTVNGIRDGGGNGNVHILVSLSRVGTALHEGRRVPGDVLLSTGVTVPLGETTVLGSTSPGGKIQALILVIRPELVPLPD